MAHGLPDWTPSDIKETVYAVIDLAELAVRLGAVSSIDRLGNVLFFDDFSNGKEAWYEQLSGTGASIGVSSKYFKLGGFSLKLVGGSDSDKYAIANVESAFSIGYRFGAEYTFSVDSNVDYVIFPLWVRGSADGYLPKIKVDMTGDEILYLDSSEVWQSIVTPISICTDLYHFHTLKYVIDFQTGYYVRLIVDGVTYDLSAYVMPTYPPDPKTLIAAFIEVYSKNGVNGICHLDSVILTQNEP